MILPVAHLSEPLVRLRYILGMRYLYVVLSVICGSTAIADVKLPAVFSDHMVLERGAPVPVWGWADAGEEITVSIAGQSKATKAASDGKWMVRLAPLAPQAPLQLTVKGNNVVAIGDVLVGEVWLCSGQSNMGLRVNAAQNYEQEQAAANLPQIRMFITKPSYGKEPQPDAPGQWLVASPETVGQFSAMAYFFGREIHKALGVPVGLINSSIGGTAIELWISSEAQRNAPELQGDVSALEKENAAFDPEAVKKKYEAALERRKKTAAAAKAKGEEPPRRPQDPAGLQQRKSAIGALFNGMIAPLVPYALRGAIWYQGEANSGPGKAELYQYQLPLLVQDWRARWGEGDFSFGWVQLPNFNGPGRNWPLVREAMLKTLRLPNTGMAITIDIGEPANIHPKNKQEAGRRMALWALGTVYGQKVVATSGPLPAASQVKDSEVEVSFTHTDGGLVAKSGVLKGFSIAGADKRWVPANARIAGSTVVVSSSEVNKPVAVRYAWENNPECNLYNGAGLPASPFRTDEWE